MQNVTNSPGVFERFPAWSPDGRRIAYFSDESGEYALHIRNVGWNRLGEENRSGHAAGLLLLAGLVARFKEDRL